MESTRPTFADLLAMLFRAHPWHGASPGASAPAEVEAFIEIVPTDGVKYELDKHTGHLRVDRPQRLSSMCPTLYGFVPQTYCGDEVAELCRKRSKSKIKRIKGDGDPLDICVLTERDIAHGDIFVRAIPIGGLRMIDRGEVDDKIIAVLVDDVSYGHIRDISECPEGLITRLRHYFLSYKQLPSEEPNTKRTVRIDCVYGRKAAHEVLRCSMVDYNNKFGTPETRLHDLQRMLLEALTPARSAAQRQRPKRT